MYITSDSIFTSVSPLRLTAPAHRRILEAITEYGSVDSVSTSFAFRAFAQDNFPEFLTLTEQLSTRLEGHLPAVTINGLGLTSFDPQVARFMLMTLASCLGKPSPTDIKTGRFIWDVTPRRSLPLGHVPTISETDHEALLHTDSAYQDIPERYVILYCVRSASDGGGQSIVLDCNKLLTALRETADGNACESILSKCEVPIKVPDTFVARNGVPEITNARLLGTRPLMRYREDLIEDGYRLLGLAMPVDIRWALTVLQSTITNTPKWQFSLRPDDILIVNNHNVLHGRTAFTDTSRLLLRLRVHS